MITKLLHTSDWHLGARFYGEDCTAEYRAFFSKLEQTVKKLKPEGLLISGDLFDKSDPARSVVVLFEEGMARVHAAYPPMRTVIIAGNHDSGEWLESMAFHWQALGIVVVGTYQRNARYFELGRHVIELPSCVIAAAPYPTSLAFPASDMNSKEDQYLHFIRTLTERVKLSMLEPKPMVLMAHCYLRSKDVPRYLAKDTIAVADLPEDYAYVAMGHAHSARAVDHDYVRYCGSPWPITANEHRPRSLVAVTLATGQPIKVQLKQLQNVIPLRLVPARPREPATVLRHLKEISDQEVCFVALNVRKPQRVTLNERLFINEVLSVVKDKRAKICSVFWTDQANPPTMTTLMRESDPADEERHNLLLPMRKQAVELYQTAQSMSGQLNQLVANRREQKGTIKGELTKLSKSYHELLRYKDDQRLADALAAEIAQLELRMRAADYLWEERLLATIEKEQWLSRMATSPASKQSEVRAHLIDVATRLAGGVWRLQQVDECLSQRKEDLQRQLQTKEGALQAPKLSVTLKQVKQDYAKAHRAFDMSMARLKEVDGLLGTSLAAKATARKKVSNVIQELDALIKACREFTQLSEEKRAQEALRGEIDGLLKGIEGRMPVLFLSDERYQPEFYKLLIDQHGLDKRRIEWLQRDLAQVTARIESYRQTVGDKDPETELWSEVERLAKAGLMAQQDDGEVLQMLAKGLSWEEKGLNELYKSLNKAAELFDNTEGRDDLPLVK